jgi:hypothetical protein
MLRSRKLKLLPPNVADGAWRGRALGMSRPHPHGRGGGCIAANGEENSMVKVYVYVQGQLMGEYAGYGRGRW